MPTFVIVGGSHDGERIDLDAVFPRVSLRKKIPDRLLSSPNAGISFREGGGAAEEYKPHDWIIGNGSSKRAVYALAGMSRSEVMERLLDGYRKPNK